MSPCGNYITPEMIRNDMFEIGRKIQLDEEARPISQEVPATETTFTQRVPTLPLDYENMTNYAHIMSGASGNTPTFQVPSNPLVPPEFAQSLDYDGVQYLNGFLRTQIGRKIRLEQQISTDLIKERLGYLIGVGNNYIILQDTSSDNIMAIDFYSIKFVYIDYR